jgi:preprotein translocase subunit SecG
MGVLKVLLVLIEVTSGLLLVGVILLQKSKDSGLGLAFGAGVGETLFGSRAGNVLTKITIGLGIVFLLNTLWLSYMMSGVSSRGSITDSLPNQTAAPVQQVPVGGTVMPDNSAPLVVQESSQADESVKITPAVPVRATDAAPGSAPVAP